MRSDLGGGKTTFVKGLARGAGSKAKVASPTFTLSRVYQAPEFTINHFDFYRLNDAGVMADQLAESISSSQTVTVVEWADIAANVLPEGRISIELKPASGNSEERRITFSYPESEREVFAAMETAWQEVEP